MIAKECLKSKTLLDLFNKYAKTTNSNLTQYLGNGDILVPDNVTNCNVFNNTFKILLIRKFFFESPMSFLFLTRSYLTRFYKTFWEKYSKKNSELLSIASVKVFSMTDIISMQEGIFDHTKSLVAAFIWFIENKKLVNKDYIELIENTYKQILKDVAINDEVKKYLSICYYKTFSVVPKDITGKELICSEIIFENLIGLQLPEKISNIINHIIEAI